MGITKFTIGMKELLAPEYLEAMKFEIRIIEVCRPFFQYRNTLHYYMQESFWLRKSDFSNLTMIINFLNNHLVRIHNTIIDELGKDESYKLKIIDLSSVGSGLAAF